MQTQLQKPVNGNRSLICFGISLPLTVALIIDFVVLKSSNSIIRSGTPIFFLALLAGIAGLVFGVRGTTRHEESFRCQFGLFFNAIMLFSLFGIVAIFFFVRSLGPGMM